MSTMKTRQEIEARSIAEQAAEWLLILEDGRPEDHAAFADWLARSPLHVGAFLRASAVDALVGEVDPERSIEIDIAALRADEPDIGRLPEQEASERAASADNGATPQDRPRRFGMAKWAKWALAACTTIAAAGLALFFAHPISGDAWKHYTTAVGEQRAIQLEDDSVIFLGPASRIDVRYAPDERELHLQAGQAVFRVHHDPQRPFRVHSGRAVVEAVGTEFDVHRTRGESVVAVIEGVVEVTRERTLLQALAAPVTGTSKADLQPVRLTAGEEVRVKPNGKATPPTKANVDHLQAWKERRLTFINETLYTITDEFNRYNRTPKLFVADAAAGERRYAAAFDADDPESLIAVLEKDPQLQVERRGSDFVIRSRAQ